MFKLDYHYFLKVIPKYLKENIHQKTNETVQLMLLCRSNPGNPTVRVLLQESERYTDINMGTIYGLYVNKCQGDVHKCAELFSCIVVNELNKQNYLIEQEEYAL